MYPNFGYHNTSVSSFQITITKTGVMENLTSVLDGSFLIQYES